MKVMKYEKYLVNALWKDHSGGSSIPDRVC